MRLPAFIAMVVLGHLGIVGARMTTSLFALKLGASAFTVGLLLALFAVLPMLLSVSAGRFIDRAGTVRPLLASYAVLALSIALPYAWPRLETLYFSSTLAGTAFMVLHIAVNSATGAFGKPEDRPLNFSWLSLGFSTSGSLAPSMPPSACRTHRGTCSPASSSSPTFARWPGPWARGASTSSIAT